MSYNPDIHQRRSIRLKRYDYATPGAYFVTVCTHERECLFGDIVDDVMRLNEAGRMVNTVWDEIPAHYPGIDVDAFIVMPNHIHGIVAIVGAAPRGRPGPEPSSVTVGAAPRGRLGLWTSNNVHVPQGQGNHRDINSIMHRFPSSERRQLMN
jgi:hypothetical protein